jgi:hypothetical protein
MFHTEAQSAQRPSSEEWIVPDPFGFLCALRVSV